MSKINEKALQKHLSEVKMSAEILDLYKDVIDKTKLQRLPLRTANSVAETDYSILQNQGIEIAKSHCGWLSQPPIELVNMDPNFGSLDASCRHPGCKAKRIETYKSGKRDLFLCESHRDTLHDYFITKIQEKLGSSNSTIDSVIKQAITTKVYQDHDLGYTELIPLLNAVCYEKGTVFKGHETGKLILDMCLNARNFFLIFNTLLNPDDHNMNFLAYPIELLREFFRQLHSLESSPKVLQVLRDTMRDIISGICFAFGIVFSWLADIYSTAGGRIGGGMGLLGGAAIGAFTAGPLGVLLGGVVGGIGGGMIGAGIYEERQRRADKSDQERQRQDMIRLFQNAGVLNIRFYEANAFPSGQLRLRIVIDIYS